MDKRHNNRSNKRSDKRSNKRPFIGIDIDNTIVDTDGGFKKVLKDIYDVDYKDEYVDNNKVLKHISYEECQDLWKIVSFSPTLLYNFEPRDDFVKIVNSLGKKYRFVAITSRPDLQLANTFKYLNTFFPGKFKEVVCCNPREYKVNVKSKADICKMYSCKYFIDDSFGHILDVNENYEGIEKIFWLNNMDRKVEINEKNNKIVIVKDWDEIISEMD
jgi:hypothetical protein